MAFAPEELAAAYALNVVPRLQIRPSTALGLYWERPYREYRIVTAKRWVEPGSTQLSLRFPGEDE